MREVPFVAEVGIRRHKENELLEDKRIGAEQCTETKKATWGSRFFWWLTIPEESLPKLRESHTSQCSYISSYRQGEIASPQGFLCQISCGTALTGNRGYPRTIRYNQ